MKILYNIEGIPYPCKVTVQSLRPQPFINLFRTKPQISECKPQISECKLFVMHFSAKLLRKI